MSIIKDSLSALKPGSVVKLTQNSGYSVYGVVTANDGSESLSLSVTTVATLRYDQIAALEVTVNDFYINPNTDYVIKADGQPIAVVESNGTVNIAALNNRITAYSVMLLSGEAVTLTADEYKELQTAIDIYIDSWVRSKKATG